MVAFCYWMDKVFSPSDDKKAGGRKKKEALIFRFIFFTVRTVLPQMRQRKTTFHVKKELEVWVLLLPSGNSAKAESQRSFVMIVKEEFQASGKWSKSIISFQWYYWGEAKFPDYSHKRKISNTCGSRDMFNDPCHERKRFLKVRHG